MDHPLKTPQNAQKILNTNKGKIVSVGTQRIYILTEKQQQEAFNSGDWLIGEYIMIPDSMSDNEALEKYGE